MEAVKIEVTVTCEVDNDWIDFLNHSDIFGSGYCGYWMFGMEHSDELGWLCYEHDERKSLHEVADHPEYESIVETWRAGKPLPQGWYRLDRAAAIQAWIAGVKRWGTEWYESPEADATSYDLVIQTALLGEVIYG